MKTTTLLILILSSLSPHAADEGFTSLFNGKDLRIEPLPEENILLFDPAGLPADAKKIERPRTVRPRGTGPVIAPAKK